MDSCEPGDCPLREEAVPEGGGHLEEAATPRRQLPERDGYQEEGATRRNIKLPGEAKLRRELEAPTSISQKSVSRMAEMLQNYLVRW